MGPQLFSPFPVEYPPFTVLVAAQVAFNVTPRKPECTDKVKKSKWISCRSVFLHTDNLSVTRAKIIFFRFFLPMHFAPRAELKYFHGPLYEPELIDCSHWQESRSRKISRRNYSLFSRSLEKTGFSFLFLFSIFKIFRKKFYFSSRFVRFLNPFSFSSWFSRFLRKISLSLLDWWDSETQISFSSRFSRYLEKILFLFSIYEIFENNSLSLLNFQGF